MFGYISIYSAFGAALISIGLYLYGRKTGKELITGARIFYYIFAFFITAAIAFLFYLFLTSQFQYQYVFAYSSQDLPYYFKISSLWAGQEGTFLLWIFLSALLGLWVMRRAGKDESLVMPIYLISQMFLFMLMFIQSPFAKLAGMPPDGRGLNALLQNYWMVIHPPIVFAGFASLSIPFAFSIAALIQNKYDNWVKITMPWVAFSAALLGLGIFLGGYWAYETLGWGGYWAWDPVENSSLVPWLFAVALLHGMLIEKSRGSMRKSNLFLASTTYITVMYGTFLTRSGVLADFSVHSFVDLGLNNYLLASLGFFVIMAWGLLLIRSRNIQSEPTSRSYFSKESFIYLTLLFLTISAMIVLLGTSAPIITRALGQASAIRINYYIATHVPLAILMTLAMGLFPFSFWRLKSQSLMYRRGLMVLIPSVVALIIGLILGLKFEHLVLSFTSMGALVSNAILFTERMKASPGSTAGMIAHVGVAVLLIGIIGSTGYSQTKQVISKRDQEGSAFERSFLLKNVEQLKHDKKRIDLEVKDGGGYFTAQMYFTDSEGGQVRTPSIKKYLLYDLYISPGQLDLSDKPSPVTFAKGEMKWAGDYEVQFADFEIEMDNGGTGMVSVAAEVNIKDGDSTYTIFPELKNSSDGLHSEPARTRFGGTVDIASINADKGQISLILDGFSDPLKAEASETIYFQVSTKPLINLVWVGALMMVIGALISFKRRSNLSALAGLPGKSDNLKSKE